MVKSMLFADYAVERIAKTDHSESVARRLITGESAETYFKTCYTQVDAFQDYSMKDTTKLACGFDFLLSLQESNYCVEVKGLNASSGNIQLTEKECAVAHDLRDRYCLFVVMNFIEKPFHRLYFDPIYCGLQFQKTERAVVQISYTANIKK
jgi:hypothetical protein